MNTPDDASSAGDPAAFVAKWRGAWPEWSLVEGFLPVAQRPLIEAWQALQFEWQEAAWRGEEARPGEAKLRWWVEELDGWSKGLRRHPLGALLQKQPAPWREVALALPSLAATHERPIDADAAWASLEPIARAVVAVDEALLQHRSDAHVVAATWLHARLARHPDSAVPQSLGTGDAGIRAWSHALRAGWPRASGLAPSRGIEAALAASRLKRGDASAALPPLAALWAGWRGARG